MSVEGHIQFQPSLTMDMQELGILNRVLAYYLECAVNIPDDDPVKDIAKKVEDLLLDAQRVEDILQGGGAVAGPPQMVLLEEQPQVEESAVELAEPPPNVGAPPPSAPGPTIVESDIPELVPPPPPPTPPVP